jgi:hypothetical protein
MAEDTPDGLHELVAVCRPVDPGDLVGQEDLIQARAVLQVHQGDHGPISAPDSAYGTG